ncbi:hypothetical protein ACIRL2_45030 [Embleya sp. NPDC127516]|uniref:hypothetical protein n=1 Tax=Embleya sp. NPDC127516 TaxID=3363990 RepID=UPI003814DF3E
MDDAERWVVRVSDWQVTGRAETRYRGITDITVHPDGSRLGFAYFNGHEADGTWTTWHDNTESAPIQGAWFPLDVSPTATAGSTAPGTTSSWATSRAPESG